MSELQQQQNVQNQENPHQSEQETQVPNNDKSLQKEQNQLDENKQTQNEQQFGQQQQFQEQIQQQKNQQQYSTTIQQQIEQQTQAVYEQQTIQQPVHQKSQQTNSNKQHQTFENSSLCNNKLQQMIEQSQIPVVPPTPLQLQQWERQNQQKQRLINQILRMYDDFQRLQIRSEELQQENHYFQNKISQYHAIIYEDLN